MIASRPVDELCLSVLALGRVVSGPKHGPARARVAKDQRGGLSDALQRGLSEVAHVVSSCAIAARI